MIKKTIGGERLGSGNRMKAELHNYERSTHNLGNTWKSSVAPGTLVPFFKKICTNGDTWSIDLRELVRTMPAIGPLFGSYKLQLDVFEIPIRLYNGILHNNMTKIGMDMKKVKLPKMRMQTKVMSSDIAQSQSQKRQISSSSLWHYLGLKGLGSVIGDTKTATRLTRTVQCVPILAYYDIFKNYYANKQEEKAFVITNSVTAQNTDVEVTAASAEYTKIGGWGRGEFALKHSTYETISVIVDAQTTTLDMYGILVSDQLQDWNTRLHVVDGYTTYIKYNGAFKTGQGNNAGPYILLTNDGGNHIYAYNVNEQGIEWNNYENVLEIKVTDIARIVNYFGLTDGTRMDYCGVTFTPETSTTSEIKLTPFALENIDDMRIALLSNTTLGTTLIVNDICDKYPYKANYELLGDQCAGAKWPMAGLVVKTYQSDIFNNWLSSDWIEGVNGINEISAVAVENGKFTIDALNLAHKVYNMLNRIAISGGTYEDWQEAVYGEDALRRAESPIYCGGMSGTIAFEEVISTADTETTNAGDQPLGSLAGKGTMIDAQGGEIEIHIKEPSYIMGILSITPHIDYHQGNDFDITELDSINDLHKPELDEIGFQDLMLERAAWWAKVYDVDNETWIDYSGGKLPAWIEYMTSVNEVHGDFAEKEKLGYMVLTRDYEEGWARSNESLLNEDAPLKTLPIKDWTTYINPTKYNYQFANKTLDAQNFWVQIGINAISRRKMSAKLIPNL